MGHTRQHDPTQIILNVGGEDVVGYAEGSFVEVDRYTDAVEMTVGSDGEVTRSMKPNRSGYFKMILQQSSPLNDSFSALATKDEKTKNGVVPVFLKDANGTTIAQGAKSWVKKKAKTEYEEKSGNREWTFDTGFLDYDVGGQNEI